MTDPNPHFLDVVACRLAIVKHALWLAKRENEHAQELLRDLKARASTGTIYTAQVLSEVLLVHDATVQAFERTETVARSLLDAGAVYPLGDCSRCSRH